VTASCNGKTRRKSDSTGNRDDKKVFSEVSSTDQENTPVKKIQYLRQTEYCRDEQAQNYKEYKRNLDLLKVSTSLMTFNKIIVIVLGGSYNVWMYKRGMVERGSSKCL